MGTSRSTDQALAWRLAAEAADRCADEAFDVSVSLVRGHGFTADLDVRIARARALGYLLLDLMADASVQL